MTDDSFTFNGVDVYQLAKLKMVKSDVFTPPLRPRKLTIPQQSGAYDFGAHYHDERKLRLSCTIDGEITDEQFDSLKYLLSKKGRIVLWDNPDRRYLGRCYDAAQVLDYERFCMRDFTLTFTCDPYAYGAIVQEPLETRVEYRGTAPTSVRMRITNTGTTPINGLYMQIRTRSE